MEFKKGDTIWFIKHYYPIKYRPFDTYKVCKGELIMIWNLLETTETPVVSYVVMAVLVVAIIGLFVWQSISNKKRQKELLF